LPQPALGIGAFFNLRAASADEADGLTVLHEVNIAKVITAKEIAFNIGLSPIELLIELILRAARIQRCAGEGELIWGPTITDRCCQNTVHGQYAFWGGFGRLRLGLGDVTQSSPADGTTLGWMTQSRWDWERHIYPVRPFAFHAFFCGCFRGFRGFNSCPDLM
jgi:hypothetical protein